MTSLAGIETAPAAATLSEKTAAIAAGFIGLAVGYPSAYASTVTVFILPLVREFGWGRSVPSFMYLSAMAGIALASLILGSVIERFGAPRVAAASGIAFSVVITSFGWQTGQIGLVLSLAFLAGALGSGTGAGLYLSVLPSWFDRDLGRALGLTVVGQSVGIGLMPALASWVVATEGWRAAYKAVALAQLAFTLTSAAILFWLARRARPREPRIAADSGAVGLTLGQAIASRNFWLLAATVFLICAGVVGTSIHIFPLYVDRAILPAWLPRIALAVGAGTLVGRVVAGLMLDRVDARVVAAMTFATGGCGILLLTFAGPGLSVLEMLAPPLLIGAALGAESDILAYMARRYFGLAHFPSIYNRLLIAFYLGAVSGTVLLGWAADHMTDTKPALIGLALSCILATILVPALPATRETASR